MTASYGGKEWQMIAVVGHADVTSETLGLLEAELGALLEREPDGEPGVVRAGGGVAPAFARAVRQAGRDLVVVIPTLGMVPALLPERDRVPTGELLLLARQVRLLTYDPGDRDACVRADEEIVAGCRRLVAVWDGSPSNGRDATAHLVAYARSRGVPVEVVWPLGAGRTGLRVAARPDDDGRPPGDAPRPTALPAAVGTPGTRGIREAGAAR
ncbi:hypothetical protein [Streptomyces sp. NPDC001388]|uniref:hypothetical protein n=1 Tax=unclassified Streptomyces TaxID=2593676 RepID=UPI0036C1CE92